MPLLINDSRRCRRQGYCKAPVCQLKSLIEEDDLTSTTTDLIDEASIIKEDKYSSPKPWLDKAAL